MEEQVTAPATPNASANTDGNTTTTTASNAAVAGTSGDTSTAGDAFKPVTSQEDLNRIVSERVRRAEAKYADYADLKTKASQFDAIAEAQKTELQRAQDRAEAAEQRAQHLEQAKQLADWRKSIATDAGVPEQLLRGSTQEELLDHAQSLKSFLPNPDARNGAHVPGEGRNTVGPPDPAQQFAEVIRKARG